MPGPHISTQLFVKELTDRHTQSQLQFGSPERRAPLPSIAYHGPLDRIRSAWFQGFPLFALRHFANA